MISKEQNRAWAMTMAVAAVLLCSGCTESAASSTAQTTVTGTTTATPEQENETIVTEETSSVYQPLHQIKHVLASKHWKLKVSNDESSSWKCKCILERKS